MDPSGALVKQCYCTLLDKADGSKYLCYTKATSDGLSIGLTNAIDLWSTHLSQEAQKQFRGQYFLKSTEDYVMKIRSSCRSGSAYVSVEEEKAVFHLGPGPEDMTVTLLKLGDADRSPELRELLFGMADSLTRLDREAQVPLHQASPGKSPFKKSCEFEPRMQQSSRGSTVAARKRLPGDSLINPGSRKKQPATGVAFDDADEA
ncbi:protein PAXX [Denticeps clupeoides]|uniref:Uncharacterized protein n=1 Tax=Denticeps clupeoides TaxID=299321 RepID=A0AAY4BAJ5_9TELE|nr:protein PAXX [Denticeps clupeoides]